jgi:hypothetical protein
MRDEESPADVPGFCFLLVGFLGEYRVPVSPTKTLWKSFIKTEGASEPD